ncbi:hypothetical protein N656DRAFT_763566 [Canariomyces notabilis]|uniref:Rhodopsin domain-containing protein n=1 Tax=Canariomyces notabilis TaxID=2074819 RepID=A0AAN6T789_9PEZI|nr:hypothetical protein N656DRAFT_763566 [Canariomyces arenarius]
MSAPASQPPPPPPESWNEDRGPAFKAFAIAMTVVTVLSIVLRFWSRSLVAPHSHTRNQRRFWWDDWAALASVPFILTIFALAFACLPLGLGRHVWTLETEHLFTILKFIFIIYFIYDGALFLTKLSALLFFSRVFPAHANSAWFNIILYVTHGLNVAWFLGIVFGTVFMCNPIARNWIPMLEGTCGSTTGLWYGSAIPSVAIDLIILLLPLPKTWGLQTSLARKGGIVAIFLLGYCVVVVSLGRLITLVKSGKALDDDITYEGMPVIYWVAAESPILLLGICLPAMLPLGRHMASSYFSPLMSKASTLLSSRRSANRSGNFSSIPGNHSVQSGIAKKRSNHDADNGDTELGSVSSMDSQRGVLRVTPYHDAHTARVRVGDAGDSLGHAQVPNRSIRVENAVTVSRQGL